MGRGDLGYRFAIGALIALTLRVRTVLSTISSPQRDSRSSPAATGTPLATPTTLNSGSAVHGPSHDYRSTDDDNHNSSCALRHPACLAIAYGDQLHDLADECGI